MSLKQYFKDKKKQIDDYLEHKALQKEQQKQSRILQEKLERESLKQDAIKAKKELKELKQMEKDKAIIQKAKDYKKSLQPESKLVKFANKADKALASMQDFASKFEIADGKDIIGDIDLPKPSQTKQDFGFDLSPSGDMDFGIANIKPKRGK